MARNVFASILADVRAPVERDPAARGYLDVLISYPGWKALTVHRFAHALYRARIPLLQRFVSSLSRFWTGIEIDPGATIGDGVFIDHGVGVVIGETAEVGDGCTIYQGVTLGGTSLQRTKRHPTLGRNVSVGSGAAVIGAITVGDGAKIGANSVVVKDVPPNATIVGIPGRVVLQDGKPVQAVDARPRLEMPDPNAAVFAQLTERIAELEARLDELERKNAPSSV